MPAQKSEVAKEQKLRDDLSELLHFTSVSINRIYIVVSKTIVRQEAQMSADISPEVKRLAVGTRIVAVEVSLYSAASI